jgi:hypothetical protein
VTVVVTDAAIGLEGYRRPVPTPRRDPLERLAAWLVTGPAGHFYGGAADWLEFFVRWRLDQRRSARPKSAR